MWQTQTLCSCWWNSFGNKFCNKVAIELRRLPVGGHAKLKYYIKYAAALLQHIRIDINENQAGCRV